MDRECIAYLISRYPAVSHTFIQREISQLRAHGLDIITASINLPDIAVEQQTEADREEIKKTFYIKEQGFLKAFIILIKIVCCRPLSFLKGFWFAFRWAGWDLGRMLWHFFYLIEACLLGNWMNKRKIDHVHVHFANPASNVALILTKIFPITFSITVHGPDEFFDVHLNGLKEKFNQASFIFCISHYARSQVMRLLPSEKWNKIEIIRMGVDPALYAPLKGKQEKSIPHILCVGRLTPAKGQAILLEAFAQLIKQGKEAHLHLVGAGADLPSLTRHAQTLNIAPRVFFHGALNQQQTLNILQQADIFVLPSFAEGIPVALMEAMSIEIPCISTLISGIPELILQETNGLLVRASDSTELFQAINRLYDDPALRRSLGKAGRQQILEHYDLTKNTRQLAQLFRKQLQQLQSGRIEELS